MTERKKQTTSFDLNQLLDADFFKKTILLDYCQLQRRESISSPGA